MNSSAPKTQDDSERFIPITEDFDEPGEVTGIRRKPVIENVEEVRQSVGATFGTIGFPGRPDRTINYDHLCRDKKYKDRGVSEELKAHDLEAQIDSWAQQRMLKTRVALKPNAERQALIERVLQECMAGKKIVGFEIGQDEDGKITYTMYYNQRTS